MPRDFAVVGPLGPEIQGLELDLGFVGRGNDAEVEALFAGEDGHVAGAVTGGDERVGIHAGGGLVAVGAGISGRLRLAWVCA